MDTPKLPKILIVGGGMGGISCALELQSKKCYQVTILEASQQIGGRLRTHFLESKKNKEYDYLEMGCQCVYLGSKIGQIAEENNQIIEDAPDYDRALETFCPVYGLSGITAIKELREFLAYQPLLPKHLSDLYLDVKEQFRKAFDQYENTPYFKILESYWTGVYYWWWKLAYEYTFIQERKELVNGYSGLLNSISLTLNPNTVIVSKEVVKIDWSDFDVDVPQKIIIDPQVTLFCKDGTTYKADHVIIATSFGFLKENYKTLFYPSLPDEKVYAIETIPFIAINKIFLEFEEPFWGSSGVYQVIWSERMEELFSSSTYERIMNPLKWVKYINRFDYVYTSPNYLCAWIFGKGAVVIESLPDEEIGKGCMILLKYLTMRTTLPPPKSIIKSTWHSNPLFRGSVAFDLSRPFHEVVKKVTETVSVQEVTLMQTELSTVLQARQRPVLQFTGDVADMDTQSSVEGAWKCGIRAAKEVHEYYCPPKSKEDDHPTE